MKVKGNKVARIVLRNSSRLKLWHVALAGVVLGVAGLVSMFALSGTVYAAGGVGSGGTGSGGSGAGHYTWYGWGWSVYPANGPGPTSGFRNGTSWAAAQATCLSAGATQVYAFLINDAGGNGMVYSYENVEEGPPQYAGRFPVPALVDHGRATSISTAQARAAFGALAGFGVNTAGYTFGVNVGWFCYDYSNTTVQGRIFNWRTGAAAPNVSVYICNYGWTTTDGNGFYTVTMRRGTGMCARVANGVVDTANGPAAVYVRPWATGGGDQYAANCPARAGPITNPDYCPEQTYECQIIGSGFIANTCPGVDNRQDNTGYDFVFDLPPLGHVDTAVCTNPSIQGWAFDWDNSSASIRVDAYEVGPSTDPGLPGYGAPAGHGIYVGSATANVSRPDVDAAYGIAGNHGFRMNLTSRNGFARNTFYLYAIDVVHSGYPGSPAVNQYIGQATIGPCVTSLSCSVSITGGEPGQPATAQINVSYVAGDGRPPTDPPYIMHLAVSGPGGYSASGNGWTSSSPTYYRLGFTPPSPGVYTVNGSFYGQSAPYSSISTSCSTSFTAYDKPYMRAYGNDVIAGGAFGTTDCSNPGTIKTYNNGNSAGYSGSGGQFGADALGIITGFASASLRTGQPLPTPATGLSFSNTTGSWGGSFGGANCIHDWYGDSGGASDITSQVNSGKLNMAPYFNPGNGSKTSGAYSINSSVELSNGSDNGSSNKQLDVGNRLIFYVKGNVYIPHNLTYSTAPRNSLADVQSFWLVVEGNIYIDPGVSQLDGVYIAQPDPANAANTGKIYTCANSSGPWALGSISATDPANCASPLTVNGAFIANYVDLLRSNNSLRDAVPNELPRALGGTSKAAEIFNFSPDTYLAPPPGLGNNSSGKYDAITELPPVL